MPNAVCNQSEPDCGQTEMFRHGFVAFWDDLLARIKREKL
jgi:hypothetical protein